MQDSFDRVLGGDWERFIEAFYLNFFNSSEEIKILFKNTDMDRQKLMLRESLGIMVQFALSKKIMIGLEEIARLHGKSGLNISKKHFRTWMECLIKTVKERDPEFDESIELAWRITIVCGIEMMLFYHDS